MDKKRSVNNPLSDLANKPRDFSGSMAANHVSFQVNWAFCKMVELQKTATDYVIVLDVHEDITVADSKENPTRLDHCQIKTDKGGLWTEARLLYRTSKKIRRNGYQPLKSEVPTHAP